MFWWIISAAALALILLAGVLAYGFHYANRALPGTSVAGINVSGKTQDEIIKIIDADAADTQVHINIDGSTQDIGLADLGMTVNSKETALEVLKPNKSFLSRITGSFGKRNIEPQILGDSAKLTDFMSQATDESATLAQNASVKVADDGASFAAVPSQPGKSVDYSRVETAAEQAARSLKDVELNLELKDVEPTITTDQAQAVADKANALIATPVSLTDGIETYSPDAGERFSWVAIPADAEELGDPAIDETKVAAWVNATAKSTNLDPTPGIRNVNSRGDVVSVVQEAAPGWTVSNADDITKALVASLKSGEEYSAEFNYDRPASDKWEERTIADGAEGLAHQAAPGEKWIDINLSNYTVSAYEGATIVRGPISMVAGKPSTPTVTGTFKTYLQYPSQTMRGEDYVTPDVPWVTYFTGSYALHGAPWRSSFGYGGDAGSHGCINMPVSEAKWFYDWAGIGTTAVSHY